MWLRGWALRVCAVRFREEVKMGREVGGDFGDCGGRL